MGYFGRFLKQESPLIVDVVRNASLVVSSPSWMKFSELKKQNALMARTTENEVLKSRFPKLQALSKLVQWLEIVALELLKIRILSQFTADGQQLLTSFPDSSQDANHIHGRHLVSFEFLAQVK